jgi:hypothetical protein
VKIAETPSTLKRLRTHKHRYVPALAAFFSPFCSVRFSGYEERGGRTLLRRDKEVGEQARR